MASGQQDFSARLKAFSRWDWMVVGGGVAAFFFSLFHLVGVSYGPISAGVNAWHSYSLLGLLLLLAVGVLWALQVFEVLKIPDLPLPWTRVAAIAAGVGTLLILLRGLTYSAGSVAAILRSAGVSVGLRTGGILLIVAGVVMTVGAVLADRAAPTHAGQAKRSQASAGSGGWTPPAPGPTPGASWGAPPVPSTPPAPPAPSSPPADPPPAPGDSTPPA